MLYLKSSLKGGPNVKLHRYEVNAPVHSAPFSNLPYSPLRTSLASNPKPPQATRIHVTKETGIEYGSLHLP